MNTPRLEQLSDLLYALSLSLRDADSELAVEALRITLVYLDRPAPLRTATPSRAVSLVAPVAAQPPAPPRQSDEEESDANDPVLQRLDREIKLSARHPPRGTEKAKTRLTLAWIGSQRGTFSSDALAQQFRLTAQAARARLERLATKGLVDHVAADEWRAVGGAA